MREPESPPPDGREMEPPDEPEDGPDGRDGVADEGGGPLGAGALRSGPGLER